MSQSIIKSILVASLLLSLGLLILGVMPVAAYGNSLSDDSEGEQAAGAVGTKAEASVEYSVPDGPITVPVYPRGSENNTLPPSSDLRDSYIVLEDGSVLSVADWILGSLKKDQAGIGMSDYENRLFLGQVARAAVGMDENLVNRSLIYTRPTVRYKAAPPPSPAMQVLQSVAGLVIGAILPGTPEGWDGSKTGGAFSPTMKARGDSTLLFDNHFNQTMDHTIGEIKHSGTMQTMIKEQKKKLEKAKN